MNEPKIGDVATCSRGQLGLITGGPVVVTYLKCEHCAGRDFRACDHSAGSQRCVWCKCETGLAYVGIHVSTDMAGKLWSSRTPTVIGNLEQLLESGRRYADLCKLKFGN